MHRACDAVRAREDLMPRVDNKGISIHYRVEGNGPPLVLVHGISDSSDVFYERGYVAALKAKYRLVLIDARGHGQSDKPHDPQSYSPERVASDIVAVLDDLGMKTVTYWGYSMGGADWVCLGTIRAGSSCMFSDRTCDGRDRLGISVRARKGSPPDDAVSCRS